nr:ACP phosphodiesterase [Marinospirillum alkaliphilum]
MKGPLKGDYPAELEAAIQLHRRIDAWTDQHPQPGKARGRFQPELRRYSGIVLDVFFDHCLAAHWQDYADEPLMQFTQRVYQVLQDQADLPGRLQQMAPYLIEDDWLGSYREFAVLRQVLHGMSRRMRCPQLEAVFWPQLQQHYGELLQDFRTFYPQLQQFVRQQI